MESEPVSYSHQVFSNGWIFCKPRNVFSKIFWILIDPALFENQRFAQLICLKKLLLGKRVFVVEIHKQIVTFQSVLLFGFGEFDKDDRFACFLDLFTSSRLILVFFNES